MYTYISDFIDRQVRLSKQIDFCSCIVSALDRLTGDQEEVIEQGLLCPVQDFKAEMGCIRSQLSSLYEKRMEELNEVVKELDLKL